MALKNEPIHRSAQKCLSNRESLKLSFVITLTATT